MGDRVVRVHVASYNTRLFTELCVRSMRCYAGRPFDLVVGDCGSTDGTVPMLHALERRGWLSIESAPGRSHGEWIDHWRASCPADVAVFVDSDVESVAHGWLDELLETAAMANAAMVAGSMLPAYWQPDEQFCAPYLVASRPDPSVLLLDVARTRHLQAYFPFWREPVDDLPNGFLGHDTAGVFAQALSADGQRWVPALPETQAKFIHFKSRTWARDRKPVTFHERQHDLRLRFHVRRALWRLRWLQRGAGDAILGSRSAQNGDGRSPECAPFNSGAFQ